MISYAQNREDVVLARALERVTDGFYVDVGAWDPVVESVTKSFYDAGWRGINLEPQPDRLALLAAARPRDTNLCLAASDTNGSATLWIAKHSPLSTLHRSIMDPRNESYNVVTGVPVQTATLSRILDEHARGRVIHFLKIDVEGHEAPVLRGADFNRHRPIVLVVEATCPTTNAPRWPAWETLVLESGYVFALFDGLNRFYVARERSDLLPRLGYAACVLDGFVTHREMQLRTKLEAAEKQLRDARFGSADTPAGASGS